MARLEFEVNGYVLILEGDQVVDPEAPVYDTVVREVVEWDQALDLASFEVAQVAPDEYSIEFSSADGREGSQTLEFVGGDALLTWSIQDQFTREEIRPYPALRQTIFRLIEHHGIHTVELTYQ